MKKLKLKPPILFSVTAASILVTAGYWLSTMMPSDSPLNIHKSPFQANFVNQKSISGSYTSTAKQKDLQAWSTYTGKLGNDILYYIFVDRFYDGDQSNDVPKINPQVNGSPAKARLEQQISNMLYDPSHRLFGLYFGGDLEGVRQKLPYLADLGVTKIVLSPIQEGPPGFVASKGANYYLDNGDGSTDKTDRQNLLTNYHGYWIRDWFRLDPRMRSDQNPDSLVSLNRLLDDAKAHNIGMILDLTLHHTSHVANAKSLTQGADTLNVFPALGEVLEQGRFVANVNTKPGWYYTPCRIDYARLSVNMLTTCQIASDLPTLNHDNPAVSEYLLKAAEFWLRANPGGAQVAGIRIDAIKHINRPFVRRLVELVRRVNPNAVIFVEDFGGGSQSRTTEDILGSVGDVSTIDFSFTDSIRHFFSGDRTWTGHLTNVEAASLGKVFTRDLSTITPNWFANPAGVLASTQNSDSLFPVNYRPSLSWITSLETHDAPRLRTFRHQMTDDEYASMIAFHFVARGVPMINYGAEIGLSVPPLPTNSGLNGLGGDPFNRQMMIWPGQPGFNNYLYQTTKFFVALRKKHPVLRYGDTFFLRPEPDLWWKRPLLMIRAYPSSQSQAGETEGILYAYSPEGGRFEFAVPKPLTTPYRMCDIEKGACLRESSPGHFSLLLSPDRYRVFRIAFRGSTYRSYLFRGRDGTSRTPALLNP